jgi:two-component system chemotaxis response regulator CheB
VSARRTVQVLVVDDSATVREVVTRILSGDPSFAVEVAADPIIAMRKMERKRPDVILLDLSMPRMDGLSFLRKLMKEDPIPVVVCSALAERNAEVVLRALEEGAVDVVTKPRLGVRGFFEYSVAMLVDTLHAAASAVVGRRRANRASWRAPAMERRRSTRPDPIVAPMVALAASTGGTEALAVVLEGLPADAPGVVVVQHMPEGFTNAFARRLDHSCRMTVQEATDGQRIRRGCALIAPGNRHLVVAKDEGGLFVRVVYGEHVARHRPSADVLFRSVADAAGAAAVGVIMTGMGNDGAEGLHAMRARGAVTLAQDEATCVVFGMPKEAIARGAVTEVVPLTRIAATILERSSRRPAPETQGPRARFTPLPENLP